MSPPIVHALISADRTARTKEKDGVGARGGFTGQWVAADNVVLESRETNAMIVLMIKLATFHNNTLRHLI